MTITRKPFREPRTACIDVDTGDPVPIEESSASTLTTYHVQPTSAPATADGTPARRIVVRYDAKYDIKFFGTCEPQPSDVVSYDVQLVLTRAR